MTMVNPAYLSELTGARLGTAGNSNSELYVKALAELGSNVLVFSAVTAAARPETGQGVSLVVKTPIGFNLVQERQTFSQWTYMGYYTLIVNQTGLPAGYQWINVNDSPATYYIPQQPGASQITSMRIQGVFYVWYRSPSHMTRLAVEKATVKAIQNLQKAQNFTVTTPQITKFKFHTPFKLNVSAQAIKDDFYGDLYALQGKRSTWYTGTAWISHNGEIIWKFTQALLPRIISA